MILIFLHPFTLIIIFYFVYFIHYFFYFFNYFFYFINYFIDLLSFLIFFVFYCKISSSILSANNIIYN